MKKITEETNREQKIKLEFSSEKVLKVLVNVGLDHIGLDILGLKFVYVSRIQ